MSGIPATIISLVALPLGIVGWAIPYWEYFGTILGSIHIGLWEVCAGVQGSLFGGKNVHDCQTLSLFLPVTPSMNAVRALEILGSIMLGFALVCGVMKLCVKKDNQALFQVAGGFAIFSGILAIIGTVIFGVKTKNETDLYIPEEQYDLHAGFGLCIVAGCLAIFAGILYFLDKRRQPPPQQYLAAQPGSPPLQMVYPAAGYSAGAPGVILSPPPYNTYPAASYSAGPMDVKFSSPQQPPY